jgi:hypothetical protein
MALCPSAAMHFGDTAARLALPMLGLDDTFSRNYSVKEKEALSNSNIALITYLSEKMKTTKAKADSSVSTLLGSWITELHMHEREREGLTKSGFPLQPGRQPQPVNHALLHQFLSTHVRDMDAKTIISVLASHDISAGECAGYSAVAGDISTAVNAALSEDGKNGALDALRVLNDSPVEKVDHLYYKHALTLLSRAPMAASKSFLNRYTEGLSEKLLLPSIMQYERKRIENKQFAAATFNANQSLAQGGVANQSSSSTTDKLAKRAFKIENSRTHGDGEMEIKINPTTDISSSTNFVDDPGASIKYLEGVINLGSRSRAVYNYLTSLYANMSDEGPLLRFLTSHVPTASDTSSSISDHLLKRAQEDNSTPLDLSYALRTILKTGRHFRSAVRLYMVSLLLFLNALDDINDETQVKIITSRSRDCLV